MNDLAAPFRQLVERRLWPVALLLVAALAAVPFLLAKSSSSQAVPGPTASTASTAQGATEPIVSVAQADVREKERKVLGSAKNPFRPAIKAQKVKAATSTVTTTITTPTPSGTSVTGGSLGGTPTQVGSTPVPGGTTTTPSPTFELYSLVVNFGETTSDPVVKNLKRLKGLPGGSSPKLVYLGLLKDHKTAVFLVDAAAQVQGDGVCEPSPVDCQTLRMKAGDTVFVTVNQAGGSPKQYELDLVKVITSKTHSTAVATKARASVAKGGRTVLRANISRVGRYRYSSRDGVLKVITTKAWKGSAALTSATTPSSWAAAAPAATTG
ncbi:MAG: hypothetical protein QOE86_446 [Solirubrobacteraceae bacterium]|nr:hypothetical protein [Solirubrobacteraceae bacterium]